MRVIGSVVLSVYDWARPRQGESRMFNQETIERLTVGHPKWPLMLYIPFSLLLLAIAWRGGMTEVAILGWYLAGLLIWSLTEYVMHRFSFHHTPSTERQVAFGYLVHGVHHAFPDDARRWVLPLAASLSVGAVLLGVFVLVLGRQAPACFAGFTHGYLAYDTIHYLIHRGPMRSRVGQFLRKYHYQHHYATPDSRYGVSSPLWDLIFRTFR
jgi:sterol desaturase/sphingolipid hydroxylase (fatty acid hydroxylase superfamily)